jgi:hypothetical protein
MSKRINKKHFLIFNNGGVITATTPKDWARGNQQYFSDYDFSDSKNTPTVKVIEKYLLEKLSYKCIKNNEVVICYDYNAV